jgi:hypothetical protein
MERKNNKVSLMMVVYDSLHIDSDRFRQTNSRASSNKLITNQ